MLLTLMSSRANLYGTVYRLHKGCLYAPLPSSYRIFFCLRGSWVRHPHRRCAQWKWNCDWYVHIYTRFRLSCSEVSSNVAWSLTYLFLHLRSSLRSPRNSLALIMASGAAACAGTYGTEYFIFQAWRSWQYTIPLYWITNSFHCI